MSLLLAAGGAAAVSASVGVTEGADTLAAQVNPVVAANSATTDGADVLAAAVGPVVSTSVAVTEGADALASAVGPVVAASSAVTEGADVLAANADPVGAVGASADLQEGADQLSGALENGASGGADYPRKRKKLEAEVARINRAILAAEKVEKAQPRIDAAIAPAETKIQKPKPVAQKVQEWDDEEDIEMLLLA